MTNIEPVEVKEVSQYLPKEQLKEVTIDLANAIQRAKSISVTSEARMDEANAIAGKIRSRQKGIEAFRLAIVAPFKQHITKIDRFFKDLQEKFDEPLTLIEKKVTDYRATRKQPLEKSSYQEGVGRTTFIRRVEFVIKDATLVPDEYWSIDEKKVGAMCRTALSLHPEIKAGQEISGLIPGIEVRVVEKASYAGEK